MKVRILATGAILAAAGAALTGAGIAHAATSQVTPAVTAGNDQFYTGAQVDAAWRNATAAINAPLPPGYSYPQTAPAFFHPADKPKALFESSLPQEFAAQYWRCAWLEVAVTPSKTAALTPAGKTKLNDSLKWSSFAAQPGIQHSFDVNAYQAAVHRYATAKGVPEEVADYNLDCGVLTGNGGTK